MPTGTLIDIPIYVFNAKKAGPTILVQAGLHGDEINGIEILRHMIAEKRFRAIRGLSLLYPFSIFSDLSIFLGMRLTEKTSIAVFPELKPDLWQVG